MGITPRDLVEDKAFKLRKRIEELHSKDYYSDAPKELVSLFDRVTAQISEKLQQVSVSDEIAVKRLNLLLSVYHLSLDEIEHIQQDNVPVEMLPLFSKILASQSIKTQLVFRPNPLYNYSYYPITRFINEVNKSQGYADIKGACDIAVISFPSAEKNSTLLHCTFSHEIGHLLNECFSITRDVEPKILQSIDKKLLKNYVTKFLESLSKTKRVVGETEVTLDKFILREQVEASFLEEFGTIIKKWLDEIVSDTFGIFLFGPAFVFAISEFMLSSDSLYKYSNTHPPTFIRLKNLMALFDELGFEKGLSKYSKVIERTNYYRTVSAQTFESSEETLATIKNMILERCIIGLFSDAKSGLKTKLKIPATICNFDDIEQSVTSFRNLITGNEILDGEKSRPIEPVNILNAAWIVRVEFIQELYDLLSKTEKTEVRNILDDLTLKSLELTEFHTKMV